MAALTENGIHIDAPLDLVWDMTNDVPAWPRLFSEYATAEVLEERTGYVKFRLGMHPDEEGRIWSWVSERELDPAHRTVTARRVETGPFAFMNIHWAYTPGAGGGTYLRWVQEFEMKPGAPVDDTAMAERINANSPVQLSLIKAAVEEAARLPSLRDRRLCGPGRVELDLGSYAGAPLVVVLGNRLTQAAGHALVDALRLDAATHTAPVLQVAHLRGVPRSLHRTVEKDVIGGTAVQARRAARLREQAGLPAADEEHMVAVALDWSGDFTASFGFGSRDRELTTLVIDPYLTVRRVVRSNDPLAEIRAAMKEWR